MIMKGAIRGMRAKKGEYGYRNQKRRERLLIIILFLLAILVQLFLRFAADDIMLKNLLTICAVLTVLPMANVASPFFASVRYRTPEREFYEEVHAYESKAVILYDLILTTSEQIIPLDAIAVCPGEIICLTCVAGLDEKRAEKGLGALLRSSGIGSNLKISKDKRVFLRRLDSLKAPDGNTYGGETERTVNVLKSLAM